MRSALAPWLLLLALVAPGVRAADEAAPTEAPAPSTTEVKGTVPDLAGRWFVVAQLTVPKADTPVAIISSFWDVTTTGGKMNLTVRFVHPPQQITDALAAANKDKRGWEPTVQDLQLVRDSWSTLAPEDRGVANVEVMITGKDAFTDMITSDEKMKDAKFLIQMTVNFTPGGQRPMKDVMLYGATEETPDGWKGNYASATVAAAPFPIPIAFGGTFRMYRLDAVPQRGFLERIMRVFSGCGRKS
jgi:hypothetical protein